MLKKEKSIISKIFWKIVISAVGAVLILIAVINLLLFFLGNTAIATVTTRRLGGADSNRTPDQRYEWSVDYIFKDKNGITFSGHATRRGSDISVKTDKIVYYFPFAAFINSLESEVTPGVGQPLLIAIGVILIYVMNKSNKKSKPKYSKIKDSSDLNDYDDSAEELFHNND